MGTYKGDSNISHFPRGYRDITPLEMGELTLLKDTTTITAVCRALGRTDWDDVIKDGSFWARGKWMEYPDGEEVFSWDGEELFLLGGITFNHVTQKWQRKLEWLKDPNDYQLHTKEDEKG